MFARGKWKLVRRKFREQGSDLLGKLVRDKRNDIYTSVYKGRTTKVYSILLVRLRMLKGLYEDLILQKGRAYGGETTGMIMTKKLLSLPRGYTS